MKFETFRKPWLALTAALVFVFSGIAYPPPAAAELAPPESTELTTSTTTVTESTPSSTEPHPDPYSQELGRTESTQTLSAQDEGTGESMATEGTDLASTDEVEEFGAKQNPDLYTSYIELFELNARTILDPSYPDEYFDYDDYNDSYDGHTFSEAEFEILLAALQTGGDITLLPEEVVESRAYQNLASPLLTAFQQQPAERPNVGAYLQGAVTNRWAVQATIDLVFGFLDRRWGAIQQEQINGQPLAPLTLVPVAGGRPAIQFDPRAQNADGTPRFRSFTEFTEAVRTAIEGLVDPELSRAQEAVLRWLATQFYPRTFSWRAAQGADIHPGGNNIQGNRICGVCVAASQYYYYMVAALMGNKANYTIITPDVILQDGSRGRYQAAVIRVNDGRFFFLDQGNVRQAPATFDPATPGPIPNRDVAPYAGDNLTTVHTFWQPNDRYAAAKFLWADARMRLVLGPQIRGRNGYLGAYNAGNRALSITRLWTAIGTEENIIERVPALDTYARMLDGISNLNDNNNTRVRGQLTTLRRVIASLYIELAEAHARIAFATPAGATQNWHWGQVAALLVEARNLGLPDDYRTMVPMRGGDRGVYTFAAVYRAHVENRFPPDANGNRNIPSIQRGATAPPQAGAGAALQPAGDTTTVSAPLSELVIEPDLATLFLPEAEFTSGVTTDPLLIDLLAMDLQSANLAAKLSPEDARAQEEGSAADPSA